MNKIEYLNKRIQSHNQCQYEGPKSLFKYRPFDDYTFDMLENRYLFLCQAEKLDDPTECMTTIDLQRLYEMESNGLKRECVDQIFQLFIKPYATPSDYEIARSILYRVMNVNGTVRANFLLDILPDLQNLAPNAELAPMVNYLLAIPEMLDKPEVQGKNGILIEMAYNARRDMGICSLSENNDIDYMWKNYAADSSGYCIEYDIENYEENKSILPVIYQDERETNVIIQLIGSFIAEMIIGISNGQIKADTSPYIRLFLTKYKKWEYQNEWRLIGEANEKPTAPQIKRIILGNNITPNNEKAMRDFAEQNKLELIYRKTNK